MNNEERRMINLLLPRIICLSLDTPCGQRRKNKSCKLDACGYSIDTSKMSYPDKKFMLLYVNTKV